MGSELMRFAGTGWGFAPSVCALAATFIVFALGLWLTTSG